MTGPLLVHADVITDVESGHDTDTTDKTGSSFTDDVSVKVGGDEDIELLRVRHQLHAAVIDDDFVELNNTLVESSDLTAGLEEETIGSLGVWVV